VTVRRREEKRREEKRREEKRREEKRREESLKKNGDKTQTKYETNGKRKWKGR